MKIAAGILALLVVAFVAASYHVSQPAFDEPRGTWTPAIADPALALTFARTSAGLVWVTGHDGGAVVGVNLTDHYGEAATADLISFVNDLDEGNLPDPVAHAQSFPVTDLIMPVDFNYPFVAAGTNFKEHAEEIYSDDPPFLFPKLAAASDWQSPVPFIKRLDFEAELAMFPLADIDATGDLPAFGLILANDFTDRWTLVTGLDLGRPLGETGFAEGKGCDGCLPTGYLVVIPRSPEFYKTLEVRLYVNDQLRQKFQMADLILPIEAIITQAFAAQDTAFAHRDRDVRLLPEGNIPAGTLILTGTAAGVIFKPLNIWQQGFYLQPGDVVRTEATFLGHLENRVMGE